MTHHELSCTEEDLKAFTAAAVRMQLHSIGLVEATKPSSETLDTQAITELAFELATASEEYTYLEELCKDIEGIENITKDLREAKEMGAFIDELSQEDPNITIIPLTDSHLNTMIQTTDRYERSQHDKKYTILYSGDTLHPIVSGIEHAKANPALKVEEPVSGTSDMRLPFEEFINSAAPFESPRPIARSEKRETGPAIE